jgi:hypothetical protein
MVEFPRALSREVGQLPPARYRHSRCGHLLGRQVMAASSARHGTSCAQVSDGDSPTIKVDQLLDPDAHTIFTLCLTSGMTASTTVRTIHLSLG